MKAMNIIEPTMFNLLTKTHKFNKLEAWLSKALNHKLESTSSNPSTIPFAGLFPLTEIQFTLTEIQFPLTEIQLPLTENQFPLTENQFPLTEIQFPQLKIKFILMSINI